MSLLTAADHTTGTVLGQREIDAKTNEIPELRALVADLDLTGCVPTADAIHCQSETARAVVAAGGHYLLTLKANQVGLLDAVIPLLAGTDAQWSHRSPTSIERGHGRTTERSEARPLPRGEVRGTPVWRPTGRIAADHRGRAGSPRAEPSHRRGVTALVPTAGMLETSP